MASESTGDKGQPYFASSGAPAIDVDPGLIADYAAKVGNRRAGATAERNAATGKDVWDQLHWGDTTDGLEYVRFGSSWVPAYQRLLGRNVKTAGTGTLQSVSFQDICTVTATTQGQEVEITWLENDDNAQSGANHFATHQVLCDGTLVGEQSLLYLPVFSGANAHFTDTGMIVHTPAAGSHVWKLQCKVDANSSILTFGAYLKVLG